MAEIQTDVLRLTPYIEPEDNATDADRFIAGFRDEHGDTWGMKVPVGRSVLERLILGSTELSPYMDSQGRIQACPDGFVDDEAFELMLRRNLVPKVEIDELVANSLSLDKNEPNYGKDGVLAGYEEMRDRLVHALNLVEAEIARRKAEEEN